MKNYHFRAWYYYLLAALPQQEQARAYDYIARYALGLPVAAGEDVALQAFFPALDEITR